MYVCTCTILEILLITDFYNVLLSAHKHSMHHNLVIRYVMT